MVLGLAKGFFRTLLELSALNSLLLFNGNIYRQTEGLGMSLPLGPIRLPIFLCAIMCRFV